MIQENPIDVTDELEEALSDQEIKKIKSKSVGGAVAYFSKTILIQAIGLASAFVLSWYFQPEDFAVYGFVTQIIGLLIFFSDVGLAATLIKKAQEPTKADYQSTFTLQQILSWSIFAITLLIYFTGSVQRRFGLAGGFMLLSLGISFPLASFKTISSIILERKLEFSKLIIPQIFEQIAFNGLLIYLAWKGLGAMAYTWAILARSILGAVIMWLIMPWQIGFQLNKKSIKELLGYGVKFQLNDFLARIKDQLFYLSLGYFLPIRQFGYINWAKNWSMYPYNLTVQNVMAITFPTFSRLQNHKHLLKRAIEKSIFFITLFIFPLLVGMSVVIGPFLSIIPKYGKWQPAMFSFILFALSIAWAAISTPLVNTLNAIGKINQSLKLMLIWTVLTWTITPIAIYFFGFNGVAIASLLISFTSVLSIAFVKKVVPIAVWDNLWRQLLAGVAMAVVGIALQEKMKLSLSNFLGGGLIVGLSYLAVILAVARNKVYLEVESLIKR